MVLAIVVRLDVRVRVERRRRYAVPIRVPAQKIHHQRSLVRRHAVFQMVLVRASQMPAARHVMVIIPVVTIVQVRAAGAAIGVPVPDVVRKV